MATDPSLAAASNVRKAVSGRRLRILVMLEMLLHAQNILYV